MLWSFSVLSQAEERSKSRTARVLTSEDGVGVAAQDIELRIFNINNVLG
jgi:hypothetical protein